jgi:hypothetical protein
VHRGVGISFERGRDCPGLAPGLRRACAALGVGLGTLNMGVPPEGGGSGIFSVVRGKPERRAWEDDGNEG